MPRNFGVSPRSPVERGRIWPAPARAIRVQVLDLYRYNPDGGANPRLDRCEVDIDDCGPMVLDSLIWIKNKADSSLALRRSCHERICGSCVTNIDGINWLAGTRFISDLAAPVTSYPVANMRIIKDLVANLVIGAKPRATGRRKRRLS